MARHSQTLPDTCTDRVNHVLHTMPRSGIRRLTDAVMANPAMDDAIQLGFGQPQEPTDDRIRDAVRHAASRRTFAYTPNAGSLDLRQAIRSKLARRNGVTVDIDDISVTPGATYGVAVTLGCLLNAGDEVLVPDPGYPNFSAAVRHHGGTVRFYTLEAEQGFLPDLDRLERLITPTTKALIVNSPGNPTGAVLSRDLMARLVEMTREHGIWLLSDEVYETYVYDANEPVSPLAFDDSDHVVGLYSFSKSYNMTGLRVGYVVTRSQVLQRALLNAQELYISCAPSVSQEAALRALSDCDDVLAQMRTHYEAKRNLVIEELGSFIGYRPQGAFYVLLDIGWTGLGSEAFADRLLADQHVVVAPGATFGPSADRYVRIAWTPELEAMRTGITRLKQFLRTYSRAS
ncbi:MAG: pyridoxal phosphate-dependent aminotransferase [Nitrospira sp.]